MSAVLKLDAEEAAQLASIYLADYYYFRAIEDRPGTTGEWQLAEAAKQEEQLKQLASMRDLFHDLARPTGPSDPAWLRWNDGMVVKIAQGIYDERAFDRMPILHDALLDAGCTKEVLLAHCLNPAGHVRGCWVIDQLTGRA
jgi:hypothetical protein